MRMPANEYVGWIVSHGLPRVFSIGVRLAPNVRHPYIKTFNSPPAIEWPDPTDFVSINIAIYGLDRGHSFQGVGNAEIANVAGMPDFIDFFQMLENTIIDVTVGV